MTRKTEPGRQTVFGEFQAENLASGSNNLQELFRKWNIKLGDYRWPRVLVQTNCLDITMAWKTSCNDVATRVSRFALHIIFCLDLNWGGGSCSPAPSSNDAPARTDHVTSSTTRPLCSPYAICYRCSTAGSVNVLRHVGLASAREMRRISIEEDNDFDRRPYNSVTHYRATLWLVFDANDMPISTHSVGYHVRIVDWRL